MKPLIVKALLLAAAVTSLSAAANDAKAALERAPVTVEERKDD